MPPVHPDARLGIGSSGAWRGTAGLAEDVRRYGVWMRDEAERRIGHLYPRVRLPIEQGGGESTVIAWIWARTVTCPNPACGARMPLVRSFVLSTKKGKEAWVEPVVDRAARTITYAVRSGTIPRLALNGTATVASTGKKVRATFSCIVCEIGTASGEYIDAEASVGRMDAVSLAVVAEGRRGRTYLPASDETTASVERAAAMLATPGVAEKLPTEPARGTFASNAQGRIYGFRQFKDYFSARQLVALTTFSDLVGEARELVRRDAVSAGLQGTSYADAVATYLAFAVSRCSDFGSTLCRWVPSNEKVMNGFARQALSMTWDYAEANIMAAVVGGFEPGTRFIADCVETLPAAGLGYARQADAASSSGPADIRMALVSSDPPYYDNVGYADLSDFFYVWLRRSIGELYPELFGTLLTPKAAEIVAMPHRFDGDKAKAEAHFEHELGAAFARMRDVADPDLPVTIYYAFKQSESDEGGGDGAIASTGWETMLDGLLAAGFVIDGTWPIRSEQSERMIAAGTNALASSIVLVCRPRQVDAGITTRKDFVATLKHEMPEALRTLQHGNIAPVDLAQSSIGPGMAIFSRYANVLEPDGSSMTVRTALGLINQALDEILAEQEGEFDPDTRWAIAWYEQFGLADADSGRAILLTGEEHVAGWPRLRRDHRSARGRTRLLARAEYSADWDPAKDRRDPRLGGDSRLVQVLLTDGEAAAGDLLARLGGLGDTARDLAYRMYHVAERKGWTEEARAYNALVVAWTDLARGAESARSAQPAQAISGSSRGDPMALTNKERIGRMLDGLAAGLRPVVEQASRRRTVRLGLDRRGREGVQNAGVPTRTIPSSSSTRSGSTGTNARQDPRHGREELHR